MEQVVRELGEGDRGVGVGLLIVDERLEEVVPQLGEPGVQEDGAGPLVEVVAEVGELELAHVAGGPRGHEVVVEGAQGDGALAPTEPGVGLVDAEDAEVHGAEVLGGELVDVEVGQAHLALIGSEPWGQDVGAGADGVEVEPGEVLEAKAKVGVVAQRGEVDLVEVLVEEAHVGQVGLDPRGEVVLHLGEAQVDVEAGEAQVGLVGGEPRGDVVLEQAEGVGLHLLEEDLDEGAGVHLLHEVLPIAEARVVELAEGVAEVDLGVGAGDGEHDLAAQDDALAELGLARVAHGFVPGDALVDGGVGGVGGDQQALVDVGVGTHAAAQDPEEVEVVVELVDVGGVVAVGVEEEGSAAVVGDAVADHDVGVVAVGVDEVGPFDLVHVVADHHAVVAHDGALGADEDDVAAVDAVGVADVDGVGVARAVGDGAGVVADVDVVASAAVGEAREGADEGVATALPDGAGAAPGFEAGAVADHDVAVAAVVVDAGVVADVDVLLAGVLEVDLGVLATGDDRATLEVDAEADLTDGLLAVHKQLGRLGAYEHHGVRVRRAVRRS